VKLDLEVPPARGKGSTRAPVNAPRGKGSTRTPATRGMDLDLDMPTGRKRGATSSPARKPGPSGGFELPMDFDLGEMTSEEMSLDDEPIGALPVGDHARTGPNPLDLGPLDLEDAELDGIEVVTPGKPGTAKPVSVASSTKPVAVTTVGKATDPTGATRATAAVATRPAVAVAQAPSAARSVPAAHVAYAAPAPRVGLASASTRPQSAQFGKLVAAARAAQASDLHIATGRVIAMRVNTELVPVEQGAQPLAPDAAEAILLPLLGAEHQVRLESIGYVDLAVDAPGGGRLRANISRHQVGLKGTFRLALDKPRTLDELGLPKELAKVVSHHQGFVVIAGPSGHGKTSTLAALVDLVNSSKPYHILTVEDPIEIEHPRKVAVVSQREAGRHTKNFATALKASLREDPDVIVIGELRDRESVEIALTAAETGHLVLTTMSTPSAAKTLDRLIDMFPPAEHQQVRASIAGALRAIVAQRLIPKIGGGVVPAIELVTGVLPLAVLIRDDKLFQLPNLMQRGHAFGMIRFDESLLALAKAGKITNDTALAWCENKKELAPRLGK
jgi:twitching motility protein PilT